jgi:hypothetical protein
MTYIAEFFIRFRTWIVNVFSLFILALPDILALLSTADLSDIVPDQYVRLFGVVLAIINIWMRPRPAVLPTDPEAKS